MESVSKHGVKYIWFVDDNFRLTVGIAKDENEMDRELYVCIRRDIIE